MTDHNTAPDVGLAGQLKIRNEGCLIKSSNISFKMQMCKIKSFAKAYTLVNRILYGSLFYFEVPDGKKFTHLNENLLAFLII